MAFAMNTSFHKPQGSRTKPDGSTKESIMAIFSPYPHISCLVHPVYLFPTFVITPPPLMCFTCVSVSPLPYNTETLGSPPSAPVCFNPLWLWSSISLHEFFFFLFVDCCFFGPASVCGFLDSSTGLKDPLTCLLTPNLNVLFIIFLCV